MSNGYLAAIVSETRVTLVGTRVSGDEHIISPQIIIPLRRPVSNPLWVHVRSQGICSSGTRKLPSPAWFPTIAVLGVGCAEPRSGGGVEPGASAPESSVRGEREPRKGRRGVGRPGRRRPFGAPKREAPPQTGACAPAYTPSPLRGGIIESLQVASILCVLTPAEVKRDVVPPGRKNRQAGIQRFRSCRPASARRPSRR